MLYVTHHLIRYSGGAHEYFRERSDRFFVLSVTPTFMREPCRLDEFRSGRLHVSRVMRLHIGMPMPIQYALFLAYYLWTAAIAVSRGTLIVNYHPLFCVGHAWLVRLRRHRVVFWVFDYFDRHDGWYWAYNRIADRYVRTVHDVRFLSPTMEAKYAARFSPWKSGVRRSVVELGILPMEVGRGIERGRLGFVGNLKAGQGLEPAIKALAKDGSLSLDVIGHGVIRGDLEKLASRLGVSQRVRWLGPITDEQEIARIAAGWEAGLATYENGDYLECADPGKVKLYWQCDRPVIMTRVSHIAGKAEKAGAAVIIECVPGAISAAIRRIRSNPKYFESGVRAMREEYEISRHFDRAFGFYSADAVPAVRKTGT